MGGQQRIAQLSYHHLPTPGIRDAADADSAPRWLNSMAQFKMQVRDLAAWSARGLPENSLPS
jgi:hypothetical protein